MTYLIRLMIGMVLATGVASAGELVREFDGSDSANTEAFEVKAPWVLDWRVTGEFSDSLAVDVALLEAGTGRHVGNVLRTKRSGNGVRLFKQGGEFYFQVNSTLAKWTLRVEQLTAAEAQDYTPKEPEQPF